MIYVALLRGINVGGNNRIDMRQLKTCFEKAGYSHVTTYINSGNIIFSTNIKNHHEIQNHVEQIIDKQFGLKIPVVIRDEKQMQELCKKILAEWLNDTRQRTDVLFLWDEVDKPDVIAQIVHDPKIDHLLYLPGAVVWHIDRADYNKSKLNKFIGTKVYKAMTARNINTTRKLTQLMEAIKPT